MSQFNSIRNELVSKLNRHLPKQEDAAPDPLGKPIPKPRIAARRSRAHNVNGYFDEYKNGKFDEKDQGYNSTGNTDRLSAEFPAPILGSVATEDRYSDIRSAAGLENPCQYNRDHTPVIKRHSGYSNHSADSGSLSDCHSVELSAGSPRDNSRCIANEIRLPLAPPTNDESSSDEYDSDEDIPTPLPPFITPSPLKNPDATLPTPPTPSQLPHNIDEDIHAVNRFSRMEERYLEPKDLDLITTSSVGDHPPPPPRCSPPPLTPKLSLIPTVEPFNNSDDQSVYIESDHVISSPHTSHSHSRNEMSPTTGAQNDVMLNDVPSVQQMHVPPLPESAYVDMTKGRLSNTSQMLQRDTNDGTFDRESPTRVLSIGQHVNDSNTERESPVLVARMPTLPLHRPPPSILLTESHNEMQGSSRDTMIDDKQEDSNNNKTVPEDVATTQRRQSSCSPKLALPSQCPTPLLPAAPPRSPVSRRVADADNIDDLPSAPPPRPPKNVNRKTERTPSISADTIVPPRPTPKKSPGYWKQKALPEPGRESSKPTLRYTVTGQSEDSQFQEGRNNPDIQVDKRIDPDGVMPIYLDVISTPTDPDLFEDEPLYQIYHTGAVVRDMWNKTSLKGEASSITDDDEEDIYCNEDIYECLSNYAANGKKAAADNAKPITTENLIQAGHDLMEDGSLEEIMKNANPMRRLWSNTKEVEESGVLNTISSEDKKLQMSLFEIITSEASYYKSLKILKSHFLGSNRLHYCFTPERRHEYKRLFSNIEEVYKTSTSFLAHLEHQWRQSCVLDVENFCAIFNLFLSKQSQNLQNCFDVYISYCANQVFQERALSALCTDTTLRFSVILKELELDPKCSNLTLQSFLALPMQRVTRYPLLMDAVCSRISMNSPIREIANNTCDALRKLVRTCNAKATSMLALEKIALLHHQLDFKDTKSIAIVSETRMLVKEGSLKRITNERGFMSRVKRPKGLEMFLFNDMLIISKKSGSSRYTVIDYAAREHLMARDLDQREIAANNVTPQNSAETCFVLVLLENHNKQNYEYLLTCENETERTRWMEAVQSTKSKDDNERIYEEWDQPLVHVIKQYIAVGSDELSLNVSDVISVSRKMADGWYEGRRLADNDEGWFPSTYTVEIQGRHSKARLLRQEYGKSRNCSY